MTFGPALLEQGTLASPLIGWTELTVNYSRRGALQRDKRHWIFEYDVSVSDSNAVPVLITDPFAA